VRVRSGNLAMDKLIYKTSSAAFGKYLRMHGEEPFNTVIDIVFMSKSREGFAGASNVMSIMCLWKFMVYRQ